jgi:calcium/calmodulin-dependent protein kinase I
VALRGTFETPSYVYLIQELCSGGELFERLVALGAYSEADARDPLRSVLSAIAHCHARGIIHRDLKPENLLLCSADPSRDCTADAIKVADFGLSKSLAGVPGGVVTTVCGTWAYSPPEMRDPKRPGYGAPADMWALGVITYIVLSGFHPFDPTGDADQEHILANIAACRE